MFSTINIIIIIAFAISLIWSLKDSHTKMITAESASQLIFNGAAILIGGWFFLVGAVYCGYDLFSTFSSFISSHI